MSSLARTILELSDRDNVRLVYGVAASATTVYIEGSTVAVTVPTLDTVSMVADDYVSILTDGADRLVIGKVGGPRIQSGSYTYDGTSSTGYGALQTFPSAFSAAPNVVATVEEATAGSGQGYYAKSISVTATQVRFRHYMTAGFWNDSVSGVVHWVAVGA